MARISRVFSGFKKNRRDTSGPSAKDNVRYSTLHGYESWETGVWKRFPWLGILSLLGVLICLGFNVVILVLSDGMPASKWDVQPSVLLAISAVVSNWLLRFALAEGAAISWWVKAIQGCTVNDLHRYWTFANNVFDAIRRIKYFNILLLASVASVVVAIDNPLFQRASSVVVESVTKHVDLSIHLAQQLPKGYTALMAIRAAPLPAMMTPAFQDVLVGYNSRSSMHLLGNTGCEEGICSTTVQGPGFAVDCSQDTLAKEFFDTDYWNTELISTVESVAFSTNFSFKAVEPDRLEYTATYKDQLPCEDGRLQVKKCRFRYAAIKYPINLTNGTLNFSAPLSDLGTSPEDVAADYNGPSREKRESVLGGVYLAARALFESQATIVAQSNRRWRLDKSGMLAEVNNDLPNDIVNLCSNTWRDPTPQVIAGLQEIMFRTALSVHNESSVHVVTKDSEEQTVPVQMNQTVRAANFVSRPVFRMDRRYLAAGAVVMIVCVIIVASTFYGWWEVGRTVSMSPIEIAKAFNAPVLQGKGINSELDEMLPVVGRRRVRYGEVRYQDEKVVYPDDPADADGGNNIQSKLEMAHLHWTSVPRNEVQYV